MNLTAETRRTQRTSKAKVEVKVEVETTQPRLLDLNLNLNLNLNLSFLCLSWRTLRLCGAFFLSGCGVHGHFDVFHIELL